MKFSYNWRIKKKTQCIVNGHWTALTNFSNVYRFALFVEYYVVQQGELCSNFSA